MYNTDNVFYLPGNIDIRICPKNGVSSIKGFFFNLIKILDTTRDQNREVTYFKPDRRGPQSWRQKQVWDYGDQFDIPFRKNSVRFAIKRDPFSRFKSAVEMLQLQALSPKIDTEANVEGMGRNYKYYKNVSSLLDDLEAGKVLNMHFWTQTYYLGLPKNYDYVYDIKDLETFYDDLLSFYNMPYERNQNYFRLNISNNSSPISVQEEKLKGGKIDHQFDFKILNESEMITKKMTPLDYTRVKRLYKIDFENGWC